MKSFIKIIYYNIFRFIPYLSIIYKTKNNQAPVTLKILFLQKILGFNRKTYWPTHFTSTISNPKNILIGFGSAPGYSPGCYIQGTGKIYIGNYVLIGPNVGIISANHDLENTIKHSLDSKITIRDYCWIGMNSVIMPNVELGENTIVGAGSVVTKSFPDGNCVIAGNPAKKIKIIDKNKVNKWESDFKGHGYMTQDKFKKYRKEYLNV